MKYMALVVIAVLLSGCTTGARNEFKKIKGGLVGLETDITLYSANGDTIQHWHTNANVESSGGEAWWVDQAGVQHHISGTFVVKGE